MPSAVAFLRQSFSVVIARPGPQLNPGSTICAEISEIGRGTNVGADVGDSVGAVDGLVVGEELGLAVGEELGLVEGDEVGDDDGAVLGSAVCDILWDSPRTSLEIPPSVGISPSALHNIASISTSIIIFD